MSGHVPSESGIFLLEWQAEADFARNTTSRRILILFSEVAAVTLWLKSLLHNAIHFLGVRFWHCCQGQNEELEVAGRTKLSLETLWTLSPFCFGNFPSYSLSYWEANCYYPRGPITGKGISSNLKSEWDVGFFSPVLEIVILFHFDAVILMGTGDAFSVVILSRTSGECLV